MVYSSGMAAIENFTDTLLVKQGSDPINFVAQFQIYGGTFQQFNVRKMQERGIEVRLILDPNSIDEWRSKIDKNTRFLYGELPSNPGLVFLDLKKTVDLAHEHGLPYIGDSTIATPALLRPLAYGADIVVHSVTKTMSASGTGTAGAIIARKSIPSNVKNDRMKADFHQIWGPGDPHFVPRIIARARRLRRIGDGRNRVDTTYIDNAAEAHLQAADALNANPSLAGRVYFIRQGERVPAWDVIDAILKAAGLGPVKGQVPHRLARALGFVFEKIYGVLLLPGEPPMTRFGADALAKAHWFDIGAARRDLGYTPKVLDR